MNPLDLIPAPYRFAAQIAGIVALGIALMVGYVRLISYHEGIGSQRATAVCTADKLKAEQAANDRDAAYQSQIRKANHEAEQRQAALAADIADPPKPPVVLPASASTFTTNARNDIARWQKQLTDSLPTAER